MWAELNEEEGKKLIETYNAEGKTAGFGQSQQQPNKRSRFDNGQKDRNNRDNRDHRRPGCAYISHLFHIIVEVVKYRLLLKH